MTTRTGWRNAHKKRAKRIPDLHNLIVAALVGVVATTVQKLADTK